MPYTAEAKNVMLNALAALVTHKGLATKGANIAITGTASTDVFLAVGHGLVNGDIVILSGLTGGTGLVEGRVYRVITAATDDFQLSTSAGGSAVNFSTNVTAGTANKVTELSGGTPAYARKAIAYAGAADGQADDTTNGAVFDVPASTIDYVTGHSALTAGTLYSVEPVVQEVIASQTTYTLTDDKMHLNAVA